jgi:XTP/dITP diphosphohydrolase
VDRLTVVLATSNEGKVLELRQLLASVPLELVTLKHVLGHPLAVPEDGDTFEANAIQKAKAVCVATGLCALADDSGLEVDALGGRPGVRSARFAHDRATDAENNAALLRALAEVEQRTARFRCVLALVSPWALDDVRLAEGRCEGSIARVPRGSGGFGYDPLFVVEQSGRAMAELSEAEKNEVSHRARAAKALAPMLLGLLQGELERSRAIAG